MAHVARDNAANDCHSIRKALEGSDISAFDFLSNQPKYASIRAKACKGTAPAREQSGGEEAALEGFLLLPRSRRPFARLRRIHS